MIPARTLDPIFTGKMKQCIQDLYQRFMRVSDYRTGKVDYSLSYLLIVAVIGLIYGDNDIKSIEQTLTTKSVNIADLLGGQGKYEGCFSDTTLLRALHNTYADEIELAVSEWSMRWFGGEGEPCYSIDGKANRAARRQVDGRTHAPYILNAFCTQGSYIAAQIKIEDKKNELSVVRELFQMMPMKGAFITTDAFATYSFVIKEALDLGADCLVPLKNNQEKLCELATNYIKDAIENHPELVQWYEEEDNGKIQHGRIEYRTTATITEGVTTLVEGTKFEGLIKGIAIISRDRTLIRKGDVEDVFSNQTLVYLFTKEDMTAKEVSFNARNHWSGCEMIHYVLDTEFDEDRSTIRTGFGMENMSCLRKCAYSLLLWIIGITNIVSFHLVRTKLRDLNGIPELNDVEYRKLVNLHLRQQAQKKKARAG